MKRTKIVCTIGPSSWEPEMLEAMIKAGMDVARLNMSHADHATHAETIKRVRAASDKLGKPIALLIDLQGPKIRIGIMPEAGIQINNGEIVKLTIEDVEGYRTENGDGPSVVIPVQYKNLPRDVKVGENILLNDGLMEFDAVEVDRNDIICRVVTGGVLTSNKGLNLPGTLLSVPALTKKDWDDADFAIAQNADWIALSFVRRPEEVKELKDYVAKHNKQAYPARVIAKIEKPQALEVIQDIIAVSEGIMVARGDLGVEVPTETVPMVQKRLIRLANLAGIPVITATQMLDSMIRNPRPTRAEASDVANAILDGTDALMLSGETANGLFPVESVETMSRIANQIESAMLFGPWSPPEQVSNAPGDVTDAVAYATCETAYGLQAKAIITATSSGKTARAVCKNRPTMPIIAVSPNEITRRQLMLSWGIVPLMGSPAPTTDDVIANAIECALDAHLVKEGDRVVLTAGVASNMPGATNLIRVEDVHRATSSASPTTPIPE